MSQKVEERVNLPRLSLEEWEAQGKPKMWETVESKGEYEVQIDSGYGYMRLMKFGLEVEEAYNGIIVHDNVVVLDKDLYGVTKYIWR